jgi:hypothetical protein
MGKYDRLRIAWPASLHPWQLRAVFGAKLGSGFGQLLKNPRRPACGQRNGPAVESDGGGERPANFWWRMIP